MKKILIRFIYGFSFSIAITLMVQLCVMAFTGKTPMIPEYADKFSQEIMAFGVELLLIGCMSGVTSAGTLILESKRLGLLMSSVLFLVIMLGAWIPVACLVWGFQKYVGSMISTIASIVITYGICFAVRYANCAKDVAVINEKLLVKKES